MIEWIVTCVLVGSTPAFDETPPSPPAQTSPPAPTAPAPNAPAPTAPAPTTPAPAAPAPPAASPPADDSATAPPAAETKSPAKPRRVWLFIDRYKEAGGTVQSEDETTIVIRDASGEIATFAKGRLLGIVPLAEPEAEGQDGIIHLRDGTDLRAIIHEDGFAEIVYEIAGIKSRMPRDSVAMVTLEPGFDEKYRRFKEAIKPNEVDKRLTFSRWLVSEKRFELAAVELRALTKEIDMAEARELLKQVDAQLAMEAAAARPGAGQTGDADRPTRRPASETTRRSGPVELRDILPSRLVAADDVNLIRVYEVDTDRPPRLDISPDVIRELITRYGSSSLVPTGTEERNRMFSWEPSRVLKLLFELKARDLYARVRVTSEPWSLNLFRTKVHDAWLIPNCATSQCHGGIDAGRFFLHRRNSKEERVRYTNLLILLRSKLDHPLVDFEDPESSLVIQYALPRDEARRPHPDVKGWKPIFVGTARALKGETMQWIRGMYKPRPEYPVDYEPPRLDAIDRAPADNTPVER